MDFMKVFDKTVREIKREVNLKVLKVPEIEQKVLDATNDEPWGPHGTVLAEIAQGTKKYSDCQIIMNVLWTRLAETEKEWRSVYKALTVIEYLVACGSERAVDDIVEHTYQISSLSSFEYVEPSGKDVGLNVRKKSETIVSLLNNKDKIQEARDKAAANRDKYVGLSSSELACKSASFSSSNYRGGDRYRGSGNSRDSYGSSDSYKGKDRYDEDKYTRTTKSKRDPSRNSKKLNSPVARASKTSTSNRKTNINATSSTEKAPSNKYDDNSDDFDPRGISSAKPSAGSSQVDPFAQNFFDLLDAPESLQTDNSTVSVNNSPEVDLFADAVFASAVPEPEGKLPSPQTNVDLFASQPAHAVSTPVETNVDLFASHPAHAVSIPVETSVDLFASQHPHAVSAPVDFFAAPDPVPQLDDNAFKPDKSSNSFDPFAAIPMSNFDGLNPFGQLTSHKDPFPIASDENSPADGSYGETNESSVGTNPPPQKEAFQVKSGVWADTLSRGLIDLNITATQKVNLSGIGIVGGLTDGSESKDKGPMPSFNMGTAMGFGSGASKSNPSTTSSPPIDDDFFSSLSSQEHHFGSFQK